VDKVLKKKIVSLNNNNNNNNNNNLLSGTNLGRREIRTEFGLGNLKERDRLEDLGVDARIIVKRVFKKQDGSTWTGLMLFRIGTNGAML
jgi:hypothetical protein